MKGVKKVKGARGDYLEYKENLKLGKIKLPLEYSFSFDDNNNLNKIRINVKPIKKCQKSFGLLNKMINSNLEKKLNVNFMQTQHTVMDELYEIEAVALMERHMLESKVKVKGKNKCRMSIELEKDEDKAKVWNSVNSKIKNYF